MPGSLTAVDLAFAAAGLYILKRILAQKPVAPLPPGPKGIPVLGNLLQWPSANEWETFTQWGEQYGDMVHVNLAGQHMVILNDVQLAIDMLDRKGAIYSDRPFMHMACELVGWKRSLPLSPYNERLRQMRGLIARTIGSKASLAGYEHMQEVETQRFVRRIFDEPDNIPFHIRKLAGAVILNVTYGYQVKEGADPMVDLATRLMDEFTDVSTPGLYAVDVIPALDRLPDWFPGLGYRQVAKHMRKTQAECLTVPIQYVKDQLAAGTARPSFAGTYLDNQTPTPEQMDALMWAAIGLYGGGADTTVSANYTLFLAMTLNPEAQARAQAEIDEVVGHDRLPTMADRPHLPYVEALVLEVFRWGAVAPQGLPHALCEDDVHAGYFIPKGTIVVPNLWKFTHDPRTYADPMSFNPSRFLKTETHAPEADPRQYIFGFGRRVCPGLHLADQSVWLTCATILASVDIAKKVGPDGVPIVPEVVYEGHIVTHPKQFPCAVKPRSPKAEALVRAVSEASS